MGLLLDLKEPSMIIMDNASYNKSRPLGTDKFKKFNSFGGSLLVQRIILHVDDRIDEPEHEICEEDESQFPVTVLDENSSEVTDSVESMDS